MKFSIIIPAYNEADNIVATLTPLQQWRKLGHEVIVVDGDSADATLSLAARLSDRAFVGPKGRAAQMNAGAEKAGGDVFLFLHADSVLPENALRLVENGLQEKHRVWGRFNVKLSGSHPMFRVIESMMNWRSRLTGIATGDQAIFMFKKEFNRVGGFPDMPLMEDIEVSKALKKLSRPLCIRQCLRTSSRRWEKRGVYRTIFLMWRLRWAYYFGASPEQLARMYS